MKQEIVWPTVEEMLVGDVKSYIDVHGVLEKCVSLVAPDSKYGAAANLLLSGNHGLGKTLLAANLAKQLEQKRGVHVPMVVVDCSDDTFELMLLGSSRIVPGGETPFIPGPFPSAIHLANETGLAILCAEEISALTPGAQKVFNRITDWRRGIYVPDVNQYFRLREGAQLIVIGTMNPSVYGGVYSLNDDLRSRFLEISIPYPSTEQEVRILRENCPFASKDLISKAIQFAHETRGDSLGYNVSTRDLVGFLTSYYRLQEAKQDPEFSLEMMVNRFEGSNRHAAIDRVDAVFASNLKERLKRAS